jgi:hypothetical protein
VGIFLVRIEGKLIAENDYSLGIFDLAPFQILRIKRITFKIKYAACILRLHKSELNGGIWPAGLHQYAMPAKVSVVLMQVLFQEVEERDRRD